MRVSNERIAAAAALAPGALTVYLAVNGGGYFAGTQGALAVAFVVAVVLRLTLAEDPLSGVSGGLIVAAAALALFAVWTLLSAGWSDAPARALIEFDRALLYLLVLVLFGSVRATSDRLRWVVRGLAVAALAVCAIGFVSRALPELWPVGRNIGNDRLSYPITYWNALGLVGALGAIFCLHLTCSKREPPGVRVAAAGALPLLAATTYLTFSRGPIAAGIAGLIAYVLIARPRALLGGLLAGCPAAAVATIAADQASLLSTRNPTTDAAVSQGRNLALVVLACMAGAALVRALLLHLDTRTARLRRRALRGDVRLVAIAAALAIGGAVTIATHLPGGISDQYHKFVDRPTTVDTGRLRDRLTDPSNNGRLDSWRVALKGFRADRLHGEGAGTYELLWYQKRPLAYTLYDGHSLYLEVLGELGIVGLALLLICLGTILAGVLRRMRGRDRSVYAAIFAAMFAWLLHAGVDWDWEMPVVTLWIFALGGTVLAAPARPDGDQAAGAAARSAPSRPLRVVVGLACLVLAVTPARIALSQRPLDDSVRAFRMSDCRTAIDRALDATDAMSQRPEPFQIMGYCDIALGRPGLAVLAFERAVERDPGFWQYHYGLALARAANRRDPLPAARTALRLNPRDPLARAALRAFATRNPDRWRSQALTASIPPI